LLKKSIACSGVLKDGADGETGYDVRERRKISCLLETDLQKGGQWKPEQMLINGSVKTIGNRMACKWNTSFDVYAALFS